MAETTTQLYCLMTDAGKQLEALAHALGQKVILDSISVGDGGGTTPTPTGNETALSNQVWIDSIATKEIDKIDKNIVWLKVTIPADVGGFWIREFGVWAQSIASPGEKVLFAYGNHAEYYKTLPIAGQSVTHEISVPVVISETADVEIIISEVGYATKTQIYQTNTFINTMRNMYRGEWVSTSALNPEDVVTLPEGLLYPAGKNSLEVFADGCLLLAGTDYVESTEISQDGTAGTITVKKYFPSGTHFTCIIHGYTTSEDLPVVDGVPETATEETSTITE